MAQNNIENQIREKLNSREIKPTEMSWDRLDAMLSVAEEKKTKRSPFFTFRFIGIAASILVFVSLGLFFFNQKETVVRPEDDIVVKEEIKINDNSKINDNNNSLNPNQQNQQVAQNPKPETQNPKPFKKSFNQNNQKTTINPLINQEKEVQFQNQEVIAQKELPQVETRKVIIISNPSTVNVDDLLASVSKKSENKPKIKVNASSLLSQVDGELDQSFRDKVLTKINKNYQEVKVALANRNQE